MGKYPMSHSPNSSDDESTSTSYSSLTKVEGPDRDSCRGLTLRFLNSRPMTLLMLLLILADLFCVTGELLIDFNVICFPFTEHERQELMEECLNEDTLTEPTDRRLSAHEFDTSHTSASAHEASVEGSTSSSHQGSSVEGASSEVTGSDDPIDTPHHGETEPVLICHDKKSEHVEHIEHVLHQTSIGILLFMLLEILLGFVCDPKGHCKKISFWLDLVVITVSLIIDVFIVRLLKEHQEEEGAVVEWLVGVLLLVRAWRIVRITHGCCEEAHHEEERVSKLKEQVDDLLDLCEENNIAVPKEMASRPGKTGWFTF